ncbi:Hypothetical protein PHPALM_1042 [Phytophthora palmivora]|uniref:Integrase catalytic domain-containing protein n=1 Tax=Phytophthora palmivora TaxID=4796 RepID=A0A2P4YTD5_9STRA|nr:Hypothetical protein PHPALM_1042 [Phytophthora palmivora]
MSPFSTPTADVAAELLSMWYARFHVPEALVSDQGSHFQNETVKHRCARMKIEQEFLPAYSLGSTGRWRDLIKTFRKCCEFSCWSTISTFGNLNHTPLQSLGSHSPVELFTGLPTSSQLDAMVGRRDDADSVREIKLDVVDGQLDALRRSLQGMHKDVLDQNERRRLLDMAVHRAQLQTSMLGIMYFGHAVISVFWITSFWAKPHSFKIQHLISGRAYDVHSSRLKFYADSELNQTEELLELVSRQ